MNFLWIIFLAILSSSLASLQHEPKGVIKKSLKSERFWLGPVDGYRICAKGTKIFHPFDCPFGPDDNPFKKCNQRAIQGVKNENLCEDPNYVCCSTIYRQLCCLPTYPNNPQQNNHYKNPANKYPDNVYGGYD